MTEQELRKALLQLAQPVPEPDLANAAWGKAHEHRGKNAGFWLVATVACTAAIVLAVVWLAPESKPRSEPAPVVTSPNVPEESGEIISFYEASLGLPQLSYRQNTPTYVMDGRLWYSDDMEITEDVRGTVEAEDVVVNSQLGWVAQIHRDGVVAGGFGPMGGEFQPFPDQDTSNERVFAASRDGEYVAMGTSLLSGDGERLGALPSNVADTQAWTPVGLVYTDSTGSAWLWNPGEEPSPLDDTYNVNVEGWGIVEEGKCSVLYHLQAQGIEKVYEHCGPVPLVTMSPDWMSGPKLVVAATGDVFDTRTGELVQRLNLPEGFWKFRDDLNIQWGGWHQSGTSPHDPPVVYLSYTVSIEQAMDFESTHPYRAFVLGCRIDTGDCGLSLSEWADRDYVDSPAIPFVYR